MKDAVEEVCEAISDVRQLLKDNWEKATGRTSATTDDNADDWRIDWLREVDKLLMMDAGWGWEQFFRMISYNICTKHAAAPVRSSQISGTMLDATVWAGSVPPAHFLRSRSSERSRRRFCPAGRVFLAPRNHTSCRRYSISIRKHDIMTIFTILGGFVYNVDSRQ